MTRVDPWVPLSVTEGIVEQALREVLGPRFFSGTIEEVTASARHRVQELRDELGRLDVSHCGDGPVTRECPLECLRLPPRQHNVIRRMVGAQLTVGELLDAVRTGRFGETRNIGPASQRLVIDALRTVGFRVRHNHLHLRRGESGV